MGMKAAGTKCRDSVGQVVLAVAVLSGRARQSHSKFEVQNLVWQHEIGRSHFFFVFPLNPGFQVILEPQATKGGRV